MEEVRNMSQEKVALVTGVSSGIGRAIAGLLSRCGFRVFGTARGNEGAKRSLEDVGLDSNGVRHGYLLSQGQFTSVDPPGSIQPRALAVDNLGAT